jgi:hypothetical protein
MTETLPWSLSQLKVIGEYQRSWNSVGGARLLTISKRDSHVFADIPNAGLSFTAKPAEKGAPALGEKPRPGAARITETEVCLSARGER